MKSFSCLQSPICILCPGILSMFCARAGSKKVYAVEASNMAPLLPKVFGKNGFKDKIEVRE